MDKDDEEYITQQIKEFEYEYMKSIVEDCRQILHEALMDTVFSYSPIEYQRTNQLENLANIDFKFNIDNSVLLIFINGDSMTYYSNENRSTPINGDSVVHFLEVGHDISGDYARNINIKGTGYDYWNNYPSQNFLEVAQKRMKSKYPDLDFEVIREQPNII